MASLPSADPRRALAELEVAEHDRVFSLGDLVDRGPDSFQAKEWMDGRDASARFDAKEIETWSFERCEPGLERQHRTTK